MFGNVLFFNLVHLSTLNATWQLSNLEKMLSSFKTKQLESNFYQLNVKRTSYLTTAKIWDYHHTASIPTTHLRKWFAIQIIIQSNKRWWDQQKNLHIDIWLEVIDIWGALVCGFGGSNPMVHTTFNRSNVQWM